MDWLPFKNRDLQPVFRRLMGAYMSGFIVTGTEPALFLDAAVMLTKEPEGLEDDFRALMAAELFELSNGRIELEAPGLGCDLVSRYMFADDGRFAIPLTIRHLFVDMLIIKLVVRSRRHPAKLDNVAKMVYDVQTRTVRFRDSNSESLTYMQCADWQRENGVPQLVCLGLSAFLDKKPFTNTWIHGLRCYDTAYKWELDGQTAVSMAMSAHQVHKDMVAQIPDFDFEFPSLREPNDDAIDTVIGAAKNLNQLWDNLSNLHFIHLCSNMLTK